MKPSAKIQYLTDELGTKTSVVIPVETYEEMLEDIQDLVAIAERKNEESVPFDEVVKRLKVDGLL
jgi:hypothetical protein